MGLTPDFRLLANDADITATIADRFSSLTLTDESGITSDVLELVLADNKPWQPIKYPKAGAELDLSLGYDGRLRRMGLFVVDEAELAGGKGQVSTLTIRARAAPYEGTAKGKKDWQTQKTRSWKNGTTIGDMVSKMASEHGMQSAVSKSLASVALPHEDQVDESDISYLQRIAKRYDAVAKPAGGKLVFAKRGEGTSVSGAELPRVAVTPAMCARWTHNEAKREAPGTVVAFYHNAGTAKLHSVTVGSGDPVRKIKRRFKTQDQAKAAAEALQAKRARGEVGLFLTMEGRADLTAEAMVVLSDDFRDPMPGEWLVKRVVHAIGKDGGYTCEVDCERPNSNAAVQDATDGGATDEVVGGD